MQANRLPLGSLKRATVRMALLQLDHAAMSSGLDLLFADSRAQCQRSRAPVTNSGSDRACFMHIGANDVFNEL
jgi:hypothetical protein